MTTIITPGIHPHRCCPVCGDFGYYTDRDGIRRECPKPRCQRALREAKDRDAATK